MSSSAPLEGPHFARLFAQIKARLEREPGALVSARTSLRDPSPEERREIGGLLGRRFEGKTITVSFDEVDRALLAGTDRSLGAWLRRLYGPLRNRPAEEGSTRRAIEAAVEALLASPLARESWFERWVEELRKGALTRLAGEGALDRLDTARTILEILPVEDTPIALFASIHAGGTKALDGTSLERLVLGALAWRVGSSRSRTAEERRSLWQGVGVVPDDLASHVLVLNLQAEGQGVIDRFLNEAAAAGMPVRLTLHQLVHHAPRIVANDVYVCENPAVLRMAAERLGERSAPLIATEGRPGTAFWRLVDGIEARFHVRADFDKDGLEIATAVLGRTGGKPWRFDEASYREFRGNNQRLPRRLPPTPWDPGLAAAMEGRARVEEEEMLDLLLGDLSS